MITQEDITTIVAAVLDALQTNGKTIAQLTTATEISEDDYIEISGGKKVSYETLRDAIAAACDGGGGGGAVEYDGTDEVTTFQYAQNTGIVTLKQKNRSSKSFTIPTATSSRRGLMTPSDKTDLATAVGNAAAAADDAADALAAANQAASGLGAKADLHSALAPMLKTTQWPDVMVFNITPLWSLDEGYDWSAIPVGSIYLEDKVINNVPSRKLYLKAGIEQAAIVDLGTPREGTIYCHKGNNTTYVWDQSADQGLGEFVQIGLYPDVTKRLAYKLMAPMVLATMGRALDNAGNSSQQQIMYNPNVGDIYYSDGNIYYMKSDENTINLGAPDKLMLFMNRQTNRIYRWNGSAWVEADRGSGGGSGGGGISGITMNGSSVNVSGGIADLGTVITSHQSLNGYAKYVLCQDEAAYNALQTKESDTLYLIPETSA